MRYVVHPAEFPEAETVEVPLLVLGSGVAGLSAAIAAAESCDVLVITKRDVADSNTCAAQGGVAAALSRKDSFARHAEDTLRVGCGLCHEHLVRHVIENGPAAIERLQTWGAHFDADASGALQLGLEGGHSSGRVVHALGDQTGKEIQRVLTQKARGNPRIRIREFTFALDLLTEGGEVRGLVAHHPGGLVKILAGAVIVATGGAGQVFRETTNPSIATGDGHALLARAGVPLRAMEFVQFHPTTLYIAGASRLLISEAVRGEGGILRDCHGRAFMDELHEQGSLAPRDFVSRAVLDRMVKTRHTSVYLDLRHLSPAFVRERFPRIYEVCKSFGVDVTRDLVPVAPAAHYQIGGAVVDGLGRAPLAGLYVVGEAACSGLHGANRLASNSLLEGLVLGDAAGRTAASERRPVRPWTGAGTAPPHPSRARAEFDPTDLLNAVKSVMWRQVGILRDGASLAEADHRLETWEHVAQHVVQPEPRHWELLNLLLTARLITRAARERDETRGVHCRTDHPDADDRRWICDLELVLGERGELEARRVPLPGSLVREPSL